MRVVAYTSITVVGTTPLLSESDAISSCYGAHIYDMRPYFALHFFFAYDIYKKISLTFYPFPKKWAGPWLKKRFSSLRHAEIRPLILKNLGIVVIKNRNHSSVFKHSPILLPGFATFKTLDPSWKIMNDDLEDKEPTSASVLSRCFRKGGNKKSFSCHSCLQSDYTQLRSALNELG